MRTAYFPAIIETDATPGYSVFFPDLPGCVSAGDTLQEAARNAEEALHLHLEGMTAEGLAVPPPSDLDNLQVDADIVVAAHILVRAELPGRVRRINITLDENLIEAIDAVSRNRSGFIAEAAREKLRAR